ncbi:MAG: 16S rRNA (uracil(1498)-N(3))-methyltransferase [Pseudomonadota bacterium]
MSTLPRLFVKNDLTAGIGFALPENQAHYLARVMRLGGGDEARVFNGRDGEWRVTLCVNGRRVDASPTEQLRPQPALHAPGPEFLFAPLKKTRTDFAVEKATELGVSTIRPVLTARTQTQRVKTDRLTALAMEAAEQTERMDLPEVCELIPLHKALSEWDPSCPLIFCDEAVNDPEQPWGGENGRAKPMVEAIGGLNRDLRGGILIGPEGGFSQEERRDLRARPYVVPVSLGPRILRAETAAISALTIWQTVLGDWR